MTLKDYLASTGITSREMAKAASVSNASMSRIVARQQNITLKTARRICEATNWKVKLPDLLPPKESVLFSYYPKDLDYLLVGSPISSDKTVYFAEYENGGPIKIGVANGWRDRLNQFSVNGRRVNPLVLVKGSGVLELKFHAMFEPSHIGGEWFKRTPNLQKTIDDLLSGSFDWNSLPKGWRVTHKKQSEKSIAYWGILPFYEQNSEREKHMICKACGSTTCGHHELVVQGIIPEDETQ